MEKLVSDLSSFILGSLKDEESGRVAFYHYLKNFCRANELVTADLINRFFSEALQLPHWQESRVELHQDITDLVLKFFSQKGAMPPFTLDQIWNLGRIQLLLITQVEDLYLTVKSYEQSLLKEGESMRLLPDGESKMVSLKRNAKGELHVRTFNNLVRVKGNQLLPLSPEQEVYYDAGLELHTDYTHRLKPAPHTQIHFTMSMDGQITAQFISGFAFRQNQLISFRGISQDPRLFYPLKRLERFYVHRPSDPYYAELIHTLDRALDGLRNQLPGSFDFARQAFDGGQIAFDQIFPDDRALYIRLKELAKLLSLRQKGPTPQV